MLLCFMNLQLLIKLYNASGTSCLISYISTIQKMVYPNFGLALILVSCAAYIIILYVVVQLFILCLHFIFLCLKFIIVHNHTPKQRNIKLNQG